MLGTPSFRLEWPGCEADHSPPFTTNTKYAWSYTSCLPYTFMSSCLVKHRDISALLRYIVFMLVTWVVFSNDIFFPVRNCCVCRCLNCKRSTMIYETVPVLFRMCIKGRSSCYNSSKMYKCLEMLWICII